jgi:hypothetical protein
MGILYKSMIKHQPVSVLAFCCTVLTFDEHWKTLIQTADVLLHQGNLVEEFPVTVAMLQKVFLGLNS